MTRKTLLLAALIAAAPAFAQSAPPAPPAPPQMGHHAGQKGPHGMGMNARMFPSMSEAGRKTMHDAMMTGGNRRDDRQKVEAARDKMLAALEAERFDAGAVKRAMDEERALSDASRQQRQVAMLAAFQKLSAEDRKAFVTDSRAMKARMQGRMEGRREMLRSRMQMRHMGQPSAPPVPPTPPTEG
ncbi:periplasmic heavy metal sensor [Sandarakinorhabdus limnophila]|jgi:Spy/CpxP family protein refolding chaperone|uniref:periplasmic heavy metal sensor n=1 Tax=Sandarakinorhabdus limnophila TaxID=210512 RepID=UPI0026EACEF8|nr:periplasmic heavy metal sensor [Sandarakinorhabdus limnophila]